MVFVDGEGQVAFFLRLIADGIGGWGFAARTAGNSEYVVVDVVPETDTDQAETD